MSNLQVQEVFFKWLESIKEVLNEPCKFEEGKNAIREDDSTSKN